MTEPTPIRPPNPMADVVLSSSMLGVELIYGERVAPLTLRDLERARDELARPPIAFRRRGQ